MEKKLHDLNERSERQKISPTKREAMKNNYQQQANDYITQNFMGCFL